MLHPVGTARSSRDCVRWHLYSHASLFLTRTSNSREEWLERSFLLSVSPRFLDFSVFLLGFLACVWLTFLFSSFCSVFFLFSFYFPFILMIVRVELMKRLERSSLGIMLRWPYACVFMRFFLKDVKIIGHVLIILELFGFYK